MTAPALLRCSPAAIVGLVFALGACRAPAPLATEGAGARHPDEHRAAAYAGPHVVTHVGVETPFEGGAMTADDSAVFYRWDFDGDGHIDWESRLTGRATHRYDRAGRFVAVLAVADATGRELARSSVKVVVRPGRGEVSYVPRPMRHHGATEGAAGERRRTLARTLDLSEDEARFLELAPDAGTLSPAAIGDARAMLAATALPPDGRPRRYVVMLNGGSEARFWDDVAITYDVFVNTYAIPPADIYLLNYDGTSPGGGNPNGMIRGPASRSALEAVIAELSAIVDGDDLVVFWVTGHGRGYYGPTLGTYGYLDSVASVDPGDEMDYRESDFKLRALYQGGTYAKGMRLNEWGVLAIPSMGVYYRHKYVSHFTNLYFSVPNAVLSDNDIRIEEIVDYLAGDTNRDGIISGDEVMDFDGDGHPPYDPVTGTFDEDDWGPLDELRDDIRFVDFVVPAGFRDTFTLLDVGLDDKVDIDLDYDPAHPEANGTDLDGDGLFDGLDVNDDKDKDDWVSIDEALAMPDNDDITDDELAAMLAGVHPAVMVVIMGPCFSGGFAWDLRGPGRIVAAATTQEAESYNDTFLRNVAAALKGAPVPESIGDPAQADANGDGRVSMTEMFNFAASNDPTPEVPQYEDDGDGVSHAYPLPAGGDGALGAETSLAEWPSGPPDPDRLPDLALAVLSGPSTAVRGQVLSVNDLVMNRGPGAAGGFEICYYVSADAEITAADLLVASRKLPGLPIGGSNSAGTVFSLPPSLAPGVYTWGAIADCRGDQAEGDEANNVIAGNSFMFLGAADLVARQLAGPSTARIGGSATVQDGFQNNGPDAESKDVLVSIYLSADDVITRSDTLVGTRRVSGGLAAGASSSQAQAYAIPATLAPGSYFWGEIVTEAVEYGDLATDPDDSNNVLRGGAVQLVTGGLEATVVVRPGDWGSGYCADVRVTNRSTLPTTGWHVKLNTNGSIVYTSWNASFSGSSGTVTVSPSGGPWNSVILPGATNSYVGFCANRVVPRSVATVSAVY